MTRTEAAEIIATVVRVKARQFSQPVSRDLVESLVSEYRGDTYAETHPGWHEAALLANPRTVLRIAGRDPL